MKKAENLSQTYSGQKKRRNIHQVVAYKRWKTMENYKTVRPKSGRGGL